MAKIGDHRHPSSYASHLHATFDSLESIKRGLNLVIFQTAMLRAGDHSEGIANIEFANKVGVEFEAGYLELSRGWAIADVESLNGIAFAQPETFDWTMGDIE